MKAFVKETGVAAPLPRADVDTDQLIPKQFLKRIERTGYGPFLFFDWRFNSDGSERDDFVLNQPQYRDAKILVAGKNFGCGSSREHAVWALNDYGIRAVIAPSYADIFRSNTLKEGLLSVVLPEVEVAAIIGAIEKTPGTEIAVDLESQTVEVLGAEPQKYAFEINAFERHCLLEGLDDIGLSLQREADITAFESSRPEWMPDMRRVAAS